MVKVALLYTHRTEGVTFATPGTGGPVPTFMKIVPTTPQHPVAPPVAMQVYEVGVLMLAIGLAMFGLLSPAVGNQAYVIREDPQVFETVACN